MGFAHKPPTATKAHHVEVVTLLCDGLVGQHPFNGSIQLSNMFRGELDGPLIKVVLVVLAVPGLRALDQGIRLNRTLPVG